MYNATGAIHRVPQQEDIKRLEGLVPHTAGFNAQQLCTVLTIQCTHRIDQMQQESLISDFPSLSLVSRAQQRLPRGEPLRLREARAYDKEGRQLPTLFHFSRGSLPQ